MGHEEEGGSEHPSAPLIKIYRANILVELRRATPKSWLSDGKKPKDKLGGKGG